VSNRREDQQSMAINRARRWVRKGDGTGRHVKDG
jgi:hypothetical protein